MQQLCQALGNTVQLGQLASEVHQRGLQMPKAGEVMMSLPDIYIMSCCIQSGVHTTALADSLPR